MDRVLITGGAGFIGSHLADELLAAGYAVRALDVLVDQVHDGGQTAYLLSKIGIAIGPRLLMPESGGMSHLMQQRRNRAVPRTPDQLHTAGLADVGIPHPAGVVDVQLKLDVIRLRRLRHPLHE